MAHGQSSIPPLSVRARVVIDVLEEDNQADSYTIATLRELLSAYRHVISLILDRPEHISVEQQSNTLQLRNS